MKKICLLSCHDLKGQPIDDDLLVQELESTYEISMIPWDDEAQWEDFDGVIIRTTWDYAQRSDEFLEKLTLISQKTKLLNTLQVVKWNHHKGYLKELEAKGIRIVPTHMFTYPGEIKIPDDWDYPRYILKPAISATAYKTMIVTKKDIEALSFKDELISGEWLLQPFLESITQGEVSLCFFRNRYSHSVIKIPKAGDFRVQDVHGGDIKAYSADEDLLRLSQNLIDKIPFELFHARVDLVKWQGEYCLMELELIEPCLFFKKDPQAAKNFKLELDKIFTGP